MCIGGSPKSPPVPPLPPEPAPPPTALDPAVMKARQNSRQAAALAGGREKTILTSGQGLTTPATTVKKTLLGQ